MNFSFLIIGLYACSFWLLKGYAAVGLCIASVFFLFKGVRITWKDILFFAMTLAAMPQHADNPVMLAQVVGYGWALSWAAQHASFTRPWLPAVFLASAGAMTAIMLCQVSQGVFSFSPAVILSRNRAEGWWLTGDIPAGAPTISALIVVAISAAFGLGRIKLFILPVLYAVLILACGRAAMVAGALVLLMYIVMLGRIRAAIATAIGLACLSPVLAYLETYQSAAFSQRIESLAFLEADNSMANRLEFWRYGVDLAMSDPGGYGYGYFKDLQGATLHNEYLAQFVGGGWLAGSLFCCILAGLAWTAGRNLVRNPSGPNFMVAGIILTGGVLGLSENWSLSSSNFFYPFFWLSAGLVLNPSYTNKVPPENSTVRNMQHAYVRNRTWRPRIYVQSGPEKKILELPDLTLNQLVSGSSPDRGTSPSSTSEDSPSDPKTP